MAFDVKSSIVSKSTDTLLMFKQKSFFILKYSPFLRCLDRNQRLGFS